MDEIDDPGTCEVSRYDGPLAISIRPMPLPDGEVFINVSFDALDDTRDVQRAIVRGAYPRLEPVVNADGTDDELATANDWRPAVTEELAREMEPSKEWADAIAAWWETMANGSVDRSAALRDMMRVTIPGEPRPAPELRALFEAEHRRIRQRIDRTLGVDQPKPSNPPRTRGSNKAPSPPVGKAAKLSPARKPRKPVRAGAIGKPPPRSGPRKGKG